MNGAGRELRAQMEPTNEHGLAAAAGATDAVRILVAEDSRTIPGNCQFLVAQISRLQKSESRAQTCCISWGATIHYRK